MNRRTAPFNAAATRSKITDPRTDHCRAQRHLLVLLCLLFCAACADERSRVVLATTTSLEDTGLLDSLTAVFERTNPEYQLAPIAAGTGMVLEIGKRKDADVLITHDSVGELQFVAGGYGYGRRYVMQNYFVIAGPPEDPGGIRGQDALAALRTLAERRLPFVSRADDSGTHRRELRLWRELGLQPAGEWYIQAGVGMGDALLLAGQKRAYIMTDRATFTKFQPRTKLALLVEDSAPLLNVYSIIVVRGGKNEEGGRAFADWLVSDAARALISDYGRDASGKSLFSIERRD
jgi:tungstate transport system substrate-binding protein